MSYSRFALGFSRSRKITRLSDAAFRLWSSAIDYTREQLTDGFLDEKDLPVIPRGVAGTWKVAVVKEIVDAGLWIRVEGGWQIREFLDWQDSAAQVRAQKDKARERMRAVRANKSRTPSEVPVAYSSLLDPDSSSAPDPDLAAGAREASDTDQPKQLKRPANLAEAMTWPIGARAEYVEQNRHLAEWVQPEAWPEVRAVAAALHEASGGKGGPRLGKFASDSGVKRLVELYAAGFTQAELEDVCRRVVKDPWWVADGGKQRSLGALTLEVVRRATAAPGAVDHAQRKASEQPAAPYHSHAKVIRDSRPPMAPREAKAAIDAALAGMK